MKIRLFSPFLALFCFVVRLQALTAPARQALQRLEGAISAEIQAKARDTNRDSEGDAYRASFVPQLKALLATSDSQQQILSSLSQISHYFTSEAVLKSVDALQDQILAEQQAAAQKTLAEIQSALQRAGETVRSAKAPADLDAAIAELVTLRQASNRSQSSDEVRSALDQVEPTLQFVTQWQNYLSALAAENASAAQESLRNLTSNNSVFLIPRSQLLALIKPASSSSSESEPEPETEEIEKIVHAARSLPEVEGVIKQLRKIQEGRRRYSSRSDGITSVLEALQSVDKVYQDFTAGLAVNIDLSQNQSSSALPIGNAVVAHLKAELLLLALPRYIGAPAGTRANDGEDVQHFLERLASEARQGADVSVGIRAREALRVMQRSSSLGSNDSAGLTAFTSGQNQETAGQFMLAVISYQTALKSGSDMIPATFIGERLAKIEAAHPQEFAAGMERVLNPPPVRYDGRGFGMADPRFNGGNPQTPQPALLIPPAPVSSPSPAVAPAAAPAAR